MTGALRVVQRNALVYRRAWRGSVFSSFLQPTLFLLAMGLGLGTMVDAGGAALPGGVSYAEFLAPGLLAAAAMQVAGFESTYPVLGKMLWFRNYEAILATPLGVTDLVLGELAWIAVRLTAVASAFVLVMAAFDIPRSALVILAIPAAVLTGLAFAAPIMAFSATRKHSNTFNVLFRFVLTPLFLFSGVFVPIGRLPEPLARAAWLTPLFHGVELVRGLTLDAVPPAWPLHVACLAALAVAGIAIARQKFRRRLYS
jgi:lipooligosaccharide transport system permease protein